MTELSCVSISKWKAEISLKYIANFKIAGFICVDQICMSDSFDFF